MRFRQALCKLLEERGITAYRLSKDTGISDSMLTRWKSGERLPSLENAEQLADYFNVSLDYLLGRTDNPKGGAEPKPEDETGGKAIPLYERYATDENGIMETFCNLSSMSKDLIHIMINHAAKMESVEYKLRKYEKAGRTFLPCAYTPASAGIGKHMPHSVYTEMLDVPDNDMTRYATYAFRVSGDSMEPDFRDGDIVAVKYAQEIDFGDIGIFDVNDTRYIKKYTEKGLESSNPEYPVITLDESKRFCCLGAVLGKIENVKDGRG